MTVLGNFIEQIHMFDLNIHAEILNIFANDAKMIPPSPF